MSPRRAKFFDEEFKPLITPNTKGKIRVIESSPIAGHIRAEDKKLLELIKVSLFHHKLDYIMLLYLYNQVF